MSYTVIQADLEVPVPKPKRAGHGKGPRRETQFPGITRHAKEMGIHRCQLYMLLMGQRPSAELLRIYKRILKRENRPIPECLVNRAA